jgi:uncharacterized protein YbbK (DUF523 family)
MSPLPADLDALFRRLHGPDAEQAREAARELARRPGVVVVSACLLGAEVRYDGGDKALPRVAEGLGEKTVLPLCPELLGGMGCPRPAVHFATGDGEALLEGQGAAIDAQGRDASVALLRGALRAAELAALAGARSAVLKERSPSCGLLAIHGPCGVRPGRGVFAAALLRAGLDAQNEDGQQSSATRAQAASRSPAGKGRG